MLSFEPIRNMENSLRPSRTIMALLLGLSGVQAQAFSLDQMVPGRWYEVPGSNLSSVAPASIPPGTTGLSSIMRSWNGGVFDVKRDRLVVWGGGHTNYAGNEIYAFDLASLRWIRVTDPSSLNGWNDGDEAYRDGRPVSRHTYAGLAYVPTPFDALWSSSGSKWRNGNGTKATWMFHFSTGKWKRVSDAPSGHLGSVAAYDPSSRKVWFHTRNHLYSYDPATDTWEQRTSYMGGQGCGGKLPSYMTGAIDTKRHRFVMIGAGCAFYYDLSASGKLQRIQVGGSGASDVKGGKAPGFVYDSADDLFLAWNGGKTITTLDFSASTPVWTRYQPGGDDPGVTALNGTYGRMQYSPNRNLVVLVNHVDRNVFLYRHSANQTPVLTPPTPAKPVVRIEQVTP